MNFKKPNLYQYDEIFYVKEKKKKRNDDGTYRDVEVDVPHYGLVDALKFIGNVDDYQRLQNVGRANRLRFYIFDDEAGITFNQHNRKNFPLEMYDYLLQVRKINVYLILAAQKYKNISSQIREHIDSVFYRVPFMNIPFFTNFGEIRNKTVDMDGNIEMHKYMAKDEQGDRIMKERPLDEHVEYIYKKHWWRFYDDLYLNKKFAKLGVYADYGQFRDHIRGSLDKIGITKSQSNAHLPRYKKPITSFLSSEKPIDVADYEDDSDALKFIRSKDHIESV